MVRLPAMQGPQGHLDARFYIVTVWCGLLTRNLGDCQ